ncbi:MAG: tetratricopeptide repeat protein [Candidatus Omnitrophica bacterium]|nr:tetratricopeptide repeat protein [Candidatus Omnitrophota bacterium]
MKKIDFVLSVLFTAVFAVIICPCGSLAQEAAGNTPGALFYQANIYYQEGKYEEAVKGYQRLIDLGWESGNIYYNLGNSYFKKKELGLAVLSYEKARGFIPNDSDLKSNYDYTLQALNLEPRLFGGWFEKTIYALFQAMTLDGLAIFLSFIYIVSIVFFTSSLFFNRLRRFTVLVICVLIPLFVLLAYALGKRIDYLGKFAVVVNNEADAKFEPLENATIYFRLSEGSIVEVVESSGDWYKVRRFDNKLAWVKKDALGN